MWSLPGRLTWWTRPGLSTFPRFIPIFQEVIRKIAEIGDISLHYRRGWDPERDLLEVLESGESQDIKYGTTQNGPHRADIVVKNDGIPAADVLFPGGQQKMLVSALKLAQGCNTGGGRSEAMVFF